MRALAGILRTPLGIAARDAVALVVLTAIVAPILWGDQADASTPTTCSPRRRRSTRSARTTSAATSATACSSRPGCRSCSPCSRPSSLSCVGLILGIGAAARSAAAGAAVTWIVGIAVAFPGLLLALFFAIIFGAGVARRRARDRPRRRAGVRPAVPDARRGRRRRATTSPPPASAASAASAVLTRHILPNIGEPLIVNATIGAGGALLAFAGLSFIGLGVQPPAYDWGRLLMEGLGRIYINPLAAIAPGIAVVIAGLAFNLVGEAAAKALGLAESVSDVPLPAASRGRRADRADRRRGHRPQMPARPTSVLEVREPARHVPGRRRPDPARCAG